MPLIAAGRFLLLEVVGTGATGPVRRAWDLRGHRAVVVKRGGIAGPVVDHPHVLPHDRVGDLVVSPWVAGGSVEQHLAAHGALPDQLVAVLLDQLLDALGALHAAGWVHRDVKPANLLLGPPGDGPHLWLADLGSARRIGEHGPPDGTPGYVAPEARVPTRAVPTHDLYAAAMTAAELLTGRVSCGGLPRSALRPLLRSLGDHDPRRRPPTAAAARARLPHARCQRP